MNWISVNNKMPNLGEVVLVTGENLQCEISHRYDINKYKRENEPTRQNLLPIIIVWKQGCCCNSWDFNWSITHWMPLPKPPENQ